MASAEQLKFELLAVDRASRPIQQVQGRVRNFDRQVKRTSVQMNQFGGSLTGATKNLRKFALGGVQQAGYQIGDYAVQVANGTSATQAFGQQAGQFFQIFGPFGAVLGAAISVFSAFKMAADKAAGATNNVETAVTQLSAAYDTLDSIDFDGIGSEMSSSLDPVLEKYSSLIRLIRETAEERRDEALKTVVGALPPALDKGLQNQLKSLKTARQRSQKFLGNEETIYKNLLKIENDRLRVTEIVLGIRGATRQEAAESLSNATALLYEEGLMTNELRDQLDLFQSQQGLSSVIKSEVSATKDEASKTSDAYRDVLGSAYGLIQAEDAIRQLYIEKNGAIDKTAANYVDILGSEQGLSAAIAANNKLYSDRLAARSAEVAAARAAFVVEASVTVADTERAKAIKDMQEAYANLTSGQDEANTKTKETAKIIKSELSPELMRIKDASEMVGSSFESAMMSMVDGTMTAKDAFRSMARDIISELYRIFVVKQATGFITGAVSGMFNPASAAGTGGGVAPPFAPRAMGGPVSGGRPYMVGERGPELIVPSRNAQVVPNNQLGGGGGVVVNQTINVSTGVQQTVRAEIKQLMPQIADSAKAAVVDAKRRGGSYGRAFA
jgi:hypothetical protein